MNQEIEDAKGKVKDAVNAEKKKAEKKKDEDDKKPKLEKPE